MQMFLKMQVQTKIVLRDFFHACFFQPVNFTSCYQAVCAPPELYEENHSVLLER